jgi:Leucine-rich repeat (LRR) protein
MKYSRISVIISLFAILLFAGCAKQEMADNREHDYGYVQFKLYKEASYVDTKAIVPQLEYLSDATKIMVMLQFGNDEITQTLTLSASNSEAAEFGLRSEKLQLIAGEYHIKAFTLYDKLDKELYMGGESGSFTVVPGGLVNHDVLADVVERGKVRFTLVKDFKAAVKAAAREYTFDEIRYVDLTVKDAAGVTTSFTKLPAEFSVHFNEKDDVEDGYQTSSSVCDTLVSLKAGTYVVESYNVYDSGKVLLESGKDASGVRFSVEDNKTTDADVHVTLDEADEYIKDYYALKEIWEALDGENWYYKGDEWNEGANWDFNKDVDLWGAQPGVKLHDNGRVALLSLNGFGFSGHLPAAIGQLTGLIELYLGHHGEMKTIENDPTLQYGMSNANRMDRHKEYLRRTHTLTQFSEPVARGLKEHGISIPEIALYETMTEDEIIDRNTGRMKIKPMDDALPGTRTNGLKSLPDEIGNLKNLQTFFIANGDIKELPATMANLTGITDMEVYNCHEMTDFPMVLAQMPNLTSLNLSANPQWTDVDEGLRAMSEGPAGQSLQILYMNECSLTLLPKELNNMKKLGLLSVASNKISKIESAYPDIAFTQLYLDNNQITEFPHFVNENGKRHFFRIEDVETFSCTYNKVKMFPDIFDANSIYGIASIDFSYNDIEGFENVDNGTYQGVYVQTLSLANNPKLGKYPKCLAETKSKVDYIILRGCGIDEIPAGSFTGENSAYLMSLDLSYNHLTDIPREFHAGNMPYFYGIDLSYNRFSAFPFEPFDCASLTMMAIRGQRDEKGERCLKEWPTGVYNHTGLRALYMGSNDLGKIDDTISYLIYYLDISDNPNIVFDASDICYNWMNGTYFLLYDKTQDIRNCAAMLE